MKADLQWTSGFLEVHHLNCWMDGWIKDTASVLFTPDCCCYFAVFWNEWRKKKELADREQEHVNTVGVILTRNFKRRIFLAWRVTNQQEQIIAPTVARRERKHIARFADFTSVIT